MKIIRLLTERAFGPIRRFWYDEDATTSLEYALMLAFVALSAIAGFQALGGAVGDGVDTGARDVRSVGSSGGARGDHGAYNPAAGPAGPG
ncbi:MAG: Flp family type IVb pilin [Armatimonadota bacterium]